MTHLRLTTALELETNEVVRLGQRVLRVQKVTAGQLTYKGTDLPVAYVTGWSYDGPVTTTVLGEEVVIAGR